MHRSTRVEAKDGNAGKAGVLVQGISFISKPLCL